MSGVGGSSGSSASSGEDIYNRLNEIESGNPGPSSRAGESQAPTARVTGSDSGASADQAGGSQSPSMQATDDASAVLSAYAEGSQAGPARHSGESSKERLFGLYQNERQEEDLGKIEGAVDPRALAAGQQLRPSRSMRNLAAAADRRDSVMSTVSMGEIERKLDPLARAAGEGLEGFRDTRQRAKAQLAKEEANRKAMGVSEMSPQELKAQQERNANFIAASSKAGSSNQFVRAVQLKAAQNHDKGGSFPTTRAALSTTGKSLIPKALRPKPKPDAPGGPSHTKKPKDTNLDPDDPKGKRRARRA